MSSYPIMARNREMVSSLSSIPVRVLIRYNTNIISDQSLELITSEGDARLVDIVDDIGHAYGEKKCMCLIRMASNEGAFSTLNLIKKLPFNAVDVIYRRAVDDGQLPFLVDPYLESLLHLCVTPEENLISNF